MSNQKKKILICWAYREVEELGLLLVRPSLGQTGFVQVAVRHAGLHRLGRWAVGEALGDVKVVQHRHVLQGAQSCTPGLLHLKGGRKVEKHSKYPRYMILIHGHMLLSI